MQDTLLFIIEVIGTLAFAVSGIRLAARKHFDWFGAYTIGVVTAIGGGTIRDILLNTSPFWMFKRVLTSDSRLLFMFDATGLALFVVTGLQKSLSCGYPMWVAVVLGMITGSFGGVLRDVLINEEPLFFRKDIYATACIGGGLAYWIAALCGCEQWLCQSICAAIILLLRWGALRYDWHLPEMKEI